METFKTLNCSKFFFEVLCFLCFTLMAINIYFLFFKVETAAEFFTPLRLCRNLCTNEVFQDLFLDSELYGSIVTLVKTYVDESKNEGLWKTQRAALQVFANLCMKVTYF